MPKGAEVAGRIATVTEESSMTTETKESKMTTEAGGKLSTEVLVPTEEGDTVIGDIVVAKVAAAAAEEVGGIDGMGAHGVGDRVSGLSEP